MSLLHWWPLNGNTNDLGLNPISLQTSTTFTYNSAGKIGQCAKSTQTGLTISELVNKTVFSCSVWWKVSSTECTTHYSNIVCFGIKDSNNNSGSIRFDNEMYSTQTIRAMHFHDNGTGNFTTGNTHNAAITSPYDTWHHYVMTSDGTNMKFYCDGVQNGTAPVKSGSYLTGGFSCNNITGVWVNDIRIYDHALSVKEVKEISKGLVLHYNFEDEEIEPTTNLIDDGDTFSSWSSYGFGSHGSKMVVAGATPNGINKFCRVTDNYTNTSDASIEMARWVTSTALTNGEKAAFSVYARGVGNTVGKTCFIHVYNSNGTDTISTTIKSIALTADWQRIEGVFTWNKTSTSSTSFSCYVVCQMLQGEQFDFCEPQFEAKNHNTPYVNGTRSTGKVYDNSGYGYNGTVNGNLQISSESISGQKSTTFTTDNTWVATNYSTAGLNVLTYAAWVYPTARHSERSCICIGGTYITIDAGGHLSGYAYGKSPAGYHTGSGVIPLNAWSHIAIVWNESYIIGYINGVQDFKVASTGTFNNTKAQDIGRENTGGRQFYGKLADIKIYATALSAEDVLAEYNRKAAIDKNGNLFTGEFIETNTNANVADKNNQIKATYFVEGKDKVKIFGGYTELEYFDQVNPAAGATSQHNRCQISDVSYNHIEARLNVTGQGSSGGIMFSNGTWWKTYDGRGSVNGSSETVTMTPASFSQSTWTDVSWDFSTTFNGLWTSGWSDGTNYWTPQNLKVMYIKTYNSLELTGHFIPIIKNNVIGLLNLITGKFYSNTGSGSFVAGSSLGNLSLIQENKIEEL